MANVTIVSDEQCQTQLQKSHVNLYDGMLCAGGGKTDACQVYLRNCFVHSFQ